MCFRVQRVDDELLEIRTLRDEPPPRLGLVRSPGGRSACTVRAAGDVLEVHFEHGAVEDLRVAVERTRSLPAAPRHVPGAWRRTSAGAAASAAGTAAQWWACASTSAIPLASSTADAHGASWCEPTMTHVSEFGRQLADDVARPRRLPARRRPACVAVVGPAAIAAVSRLPAASPTTPRADRRSGRCTARSTSSTPSPSRMPIMPTPPRLDGRAEEVGEEITVADAERDRLLVGVDPRPSARPPRAPVARARSAGSRRNWSFTTPIEPVDVVRPVVEHHRGR